MVCEEEQRKRRMEGKWLESKMEKKRERGGGKERKKEKGAETIKECFMIVLIMGLKSAFQSVNFFFQVFQALVTLPLWDDSLHLHIKVATNLCFCGHLFKVLLEQWTLDIVGKHSATVLYA